MKRSLFNWTAIVTKAMMLTLVLSIAAVAAPVQSTPATSGQPGANRTDFNHMVTGFPLLGGHATAACETCHVGGVFKGTARNCDGCHAVGRRVIATPKSNSHIVTDAPCESCHFNTSTFIGARFNHGSATPEQCRNCHNGRIAMGKPSSHNSGKKATDSCDHCHRTSAFMPASWNHIGVTPGTCTTCHNGSAAIGKPGTHTTLAKATYQCDECHSFTGWLPARYKHNTTAACSSCHNGSIAVGKTASHTTVAKATYQCDDCHSSTISWLPARYKHNTSAACSSCHNAVIATGPRADHSGFPGWPMECNQCHFNTTSFLGALGAKPANHIPYNAGVQCSACHTGGGLVTGAALHANVSPTCKTCHNKPTPYLGRMDTKTLGSHEGSRTTDDCITCHARQYNQWNEP